MMRPVGRLVRALVSRSSAQGAVDATLADWRHERAAALTPRQRFVVNARSTSALIRTIALAGVAEFPSVLKGSLLARLAGAMTVWIVLMVLTGGRPGDDRFFLVASPLEAWVIMVASVAGQVAIAFPLVVFVTEVTGRRSREAPTLGSLAVLVGCGLVMSLVILPSALVFIAYESWWYFANAAQPAPSLRAAWLGQHLVTAALISSISIVVLFLLANGIRRVGGVVGWSVGLGPSVVAFASLLVVRLTWMPFDGRAAVMLAAPFAMMAALIWSAARLSRIAARRTSVAGSSQIAK